MNLESPWVRLFGDDSPGASVVRVKQVLELTKSIPSMALGNIVNAGLTAGVYYNSAPLPLLGGWVAIIWLLSAARLRSWWRNRRRPPPTFISRRPLVRSVIWSAVAGALWGAMGFVLLQYEGLPLHVLVIFVVGGQAAAAAIWIAPLPAASLAYILPSMLPVIAGIAVKGDSLHLAMAGMLAIYTAVLMLFSRNTHRNFISVIRADFERERLVVQLETAHAQLEERVRQRTAELSGINRRLEREIEGRQEVEAELRISETRYHTLASSVPVGIFQTDAQGHCLYVNERWSEITGLSPAEAFGDGWSQSIHPEDREDVFRVWNEAVESGVPFLHEYRFLRPDGEVTRVMGQAVAELGDALQIIGYIGSITDVTDRTRLEEQLRQSQKMEAVGQLAGGVAHDFNNMLQIVISYVHIARNALDNPQNLTRYLDNIGKGADRAAKLTRQLLTFSRKDVLQPSIVDINDLISNLMNMLARLLGENIEMSILPGGGLNSASADPGMLEQVLVNLSVNARDAMPEGGRLVLETSDFYADEEFCKIHGWKTPGNYVRISVSDTGMGMTQEVQEHIFEPFFTTKEAGKGTGLGLSMVYSIIEQHNGIINVYSEAGVGTSFQIYLPAIAGAVHRLETQDAQTIQGGDETILLAEDEASVRELLCELLEGQGYRILLAHDGEQAVSKYSSRKELIDLVIMDAVMPKMSGRTAYDQIRAIDPRVPIVYSTGYAANTMDKEFLEQDGLRIIHKPYSPTVLFQTIREVIDQAAAVEAAIPQSASPRTA